MDLYSLITACALVAHSLVPSLIFQIAQAHGASTLTIEVVDQGLVFSPTQTDRAVGIATAMLETGSHVRVGLAQVDAASSLATYNAALPELFNECRNVAIAADQLSVALAAYPETQQALSFYFTGDSESAIGHAWALEVLSQPEPSDGFRSTGRIYSLDERRLFIAAPEDTEQTHRPPTPPVTHQLFALSPEAEPNTTSPNPPLDEVPQKVTRAAATDKPTPDKLHLPQPPVTTERLPTSSELSNGDD